MIKLVTRPGWLSAVIIAATLAGTASAEVCDGRGRCVKWTADKIIAERQLVCSYAKPRFEALSDGRTVIINGKVCVEVSPR